MKDILEQELDYLYVDCSHANISDFDIDKENHTVDISINNGDEATVDTIIGRVIELARLGSDDLVINGVDIEVSWFSGEENYQVIKCPRYEGDYRVKLS